MATNLKYLSSIIPYQYFKMKGMIWIKDLLEENDYLIKIDLKFSYVSIPLDRNLNNYIRF